MSAESDEALVRKGLRAWNENDWETMEATTTSETVMIAPESWPESGTFKGWPAIRRQWERLKEGLRDERTEIAALETDGDGSVLVHVRWLGTWESGLDLDMSFWTIYVCEDDRFRQIRFHMDEASAREELAG